MKTRQTNQPKRCLKFEGWIYLPKAPIDSNVKQLRYYASRTPGRIIIYDEYGKQIGSKAIAFESLSEAMGNVEKVRRKLVYKRIKSN